MATEKEDATYKTIEEGSAVMVYPNDQESTVFYNPVQVQNRDLSILMISLFAKRKRHRALIKEKTKELRKKGITKKDELEQEIRAYKETLSDTKFEDGALKEEGKGIHILDALAASGLRSIRYWKEIPNTISHITINDLDDAAVERAGANLEKNSLTDVQTKERFGYGIRILHGDATHELYTSRRSITVKKKFQQQQCYDVIDLDPYGSAAPFLDGAVQAISNGGMLNVTCTDMVALGGSHPETCFGRYNGSLPLQRTPYLQEVALRILLYSLAMTAAKYGRTIRPILSVGMDFYVRVFVEVYDDKAGVSDLSLKIGNIYQSTHCASFYTMPQGKMAGKRHVYQATRIEPSRCNETGAPFKVGGPIWLGPMHDTEVVKQALSCLTQQQKDDNNKMILKTKNRLLGLLTSASEELSDVPLYYTLPDLSRTLSVTTPPMNQFRSALQNAGYRVSGYHKEPHAVKTDAPNSVVWDIMRVWCQTHKKEESTTTKASKKKKRKLQKKGGDITTSEATTTTTTTTTDTSTEPKRLSASEKILATPPSIEVNFSINSNSNNAKKPDKDQKIVRFPMNPQKNWGPKPRAVGTKRKQEEDTKND